MRLGARIGQRSQCAQLSYAAHSAESSSRIAELVAIEDPEPKHRIKSRQTRVTVQQTTQVTGGAQRES